MILDMKQEYVKKIFSAIARILASDPRPCQALKKRIGEN
jgi:hypothetical protein